MTNIMVSDIGYVYVVDWELARMLGREQLHGLWTLLAEEHDVLQTITEVRTAEPDAILDAALMTKEGGG
jgi:hypothetical protein